MSRFGFNFGRNTKKNNRVQRDDMMLRHPPSSEYDDYETEDPEDDGYYDQRSSRHPRDLADPRLNTHPYRASDARSSRDMRRQTTPDRPPFEDDAMLGFRRSNAGHNDIKNDYEYNENPYSAQRQTDGYQQRQRPGHNRQSPRDDLQGLGFWHDDDSDVHYDDSEADAEHTSPLKFIAAIISLIFICTITWLAYRWISMPTSDAPPIIQAETTPYRIRPDTPGGTDFPHQDKLIYGRLAPPTDQPVERLLPPPEQTVIMAPTYNQPQTQQQAYYAQNPAQPQEQAGVQQVPSASSYESGYAKANQPLQLPHPSAQTPSQVQIQDNQPTQVVPGQVYSAQQYPNHYQGENSNQIHSNHVQNIQQNEPQNYAEPDLNGLPQNQQQQQPQKQMAQNPATLMEQPPTNVNKNPPPSLDSVINAVEEKTIAVDNNFYYLQLGTLITPGLAEKEKQRLKKRYRTELKDIDLSVKPFVASDGSKKYRIVTNSVIQSRKAAVDKCATLGNACMPIKN